MIDRTQDLGIIVDRRKIDKILATGRAFDVEKGGYFDARSGCVNFWCGEEDKPSVWDCGIRAGAFPRDYVGALEWEWKDKDGKGDRWVLKLSASPYHLEEDRRAQMKRQRDQEETSFAFYKRLQHPLTDTDWESVFNWLQEKAKELLRLADLAPSYAGSRCPWCDWVLYPGQMLNDLAGHVAEMHPDVGLRGLVLADPPRLQTASGDVAIEAIEDFSR